MFILFNGYNCFISMYSELNKLSEFIYFYISKNITSHTFFSLYP